MTNDQIKQFIESVKRKDNLVNIHFKERSTITGLFIQGTDYEELKSKNFWRIVSSAHVDEWEKTKNINLARLYNGMSFTRLSDEKS
ncbi:MAG: short-chain dehydrogenase [Bacteroidia bacterium]|nr:short-chain dehydrogenase [Bacteroidia bacterium]